MPVISEPMMNTMLYTTIIRHNSTNEKIEPVFMEDKLLAAYKRNSNINEIFEKHRPTFTDKRRRKP